MLQLGDAQIALQSDIRQLVQSRLAPHAVEIEGSSDFPARAYEAFAERKLFSLAMPREYGGPGADAVSLALMVESIATVSPSASLLVFPTNAVLRTIAITGDPEQKERFFDELKTGDQPMAFCLTEPDYGSDAASLQTRAELKGDHYLVSGSKAYTTLGPHARYYLTFVRTGPGQRASGISALLIARDAPGISFGKPEHKMGLHGSVTAQMFLDQTPVPVRNRLWAEGEGWRVLSEVCNPMRVWGAASLALGTAQGLLNEALKHARNHQQDGKPLMAQQAVGFALAEMKMSIEACRSLNYRVCAMLDNPGAEKRELESMVSMAKCYAADTGMKVADLAGEVMGPAMAGEGSLAALLFCAAKGVQIFDGSNQIQRMIVARNLALG